MTRTHTGLTISGDSTTLHAIPYESRHGTLLLPSQGDPPAEGSNKTNVQITETGDDRCYCRIGKTHNSYPGHTGGKSLATSSSATLQPIIQTFGTWSAVDHKSETQMGGWQDIINNIFSTFQRGPMGLLLSVDPLEFAQKVTGICTDHAANQKKFVRLVQGWKQDADRELCGKREMMARGEAEIVGAVVKAWDEVLLEIGGMGSWELLSKERQDKLLERIIHQVRVMFGEEAYEKLTPTEKCCANLFIWTGCAMHKDLNATKGGVEAMAASWGEEEAPAKLINKYNIGAAATGSTELEK